MRTIQPPLPYRSVFATRDALVVVAVCLAALCSSALATSGMEKPNPKTPNILWLIAEDFGQHLGCYGVKEVWTPNLDRLASQGVRYIRNFTPWVPFLAYNEYKQKQYPVWNLLTELHAKGKLTAPQEFLCQPTRARLASRTRIERSRRSSQSSRRV